jgi:hypothetical protein
MDLHEVDGVTTMKYSLAFRDKAGRDHMTKFDGHSATFDHVASYLKTLIEGDEPVSG